MKRLNLMAAKVSPEAPWRAPEGRRAGTPRRSRPGCGATSAPRSRRDILRLAIIGVWAAEPRDVSLLHVLFYIRSAGSLGDPHRHRGRRPAGPGRRRLAADLAADGRAARPGVVELETPVRAIRHSDAGVTVVSDRLEVSAPPGDRRRFPRRSPAGSPTSRRCRRCATASRSGWRRGASSSAWPSTSARSGASAGSPGRSPASAARSRSASTTRRPDGTPGRPARLPRGPGGARGRRPDPRRAPRAWSPSASAASSAPRRREPIDYVDRAWGADHWSRGCYGGFMPTGAWTDYGAGPARADRPDPLGRRRDGAGLERLHGRRRRLRPGRRPSGAVPPRVALRTRSVDTARATRAPAAATLGAMGRQPHEVSNMRTLRNVGREVVLAELATRQHGVVAIAQLHELGWTTSAVSGRLAAGKLHRLHRGVYAVGHSKLSKRGRWMAGVLASGPRAVLSHRSAAELHGLRDRSPWIVGGDLGRADAPPERDGRSFDAWANARRPHRRRRHPVRGRGPDAAWRGRGRARFAGAGDCRRRAPADARPPRARRAAGIPRGPPGCRGSAQRPRSHPRRGRVVAKRVRAPILAPVHGSRIAAPSTQRLGRGPGRRVRGSTSTRHRRASSSRPTATGRTGIARPSSSIAAGTSCWQPPVGRCCGSPGDSSRASRSASSRRCAASCRSVQG